MLAFAELSWSKLRSSTSLTRRRQQWPEPEKSSGTHYCRMGKNECWQAIGPAQQMNKELSKDVRKLLEERSEDIDEGEPVNFYVSFGLYMTGRRRSCARPTIMVLCERPIPRHRARELIRESGILDKYPGVILGESSYAPDVGRTPELLALDDMNISAYSSATEKLKTVFCRPSQDLCGLEIFIKGTNRNAPLRSATIGGILRIGDRYYALTVAHLFEDSAVPLETPKAIGFEFDIDEQSDSETENENFIETTSGGSRTPDSNAISHRFAPSIEGSGNSSICRSVTGRTNPKTDSDMMGPNTALTDTGTPSFTSSRPSGKHDDAAEDCLQVLGLLCMSSSDGLNPSLDWGLVDITRPGLVMFNRILQSNKPKPSFIYPERFASPGPKEAQVLAATSSGGVLHGTLSEAPTFMRFPKSKAFQEVWTVYLSGKLMKGDCGTWVVDAKNGNVYGHIVAGSPGTGIAYVIPGYQIHNDIAKQFGCSVEMPTRTQFSNDVVDPPQSTITELEIALDPIVDMAPASYNGLPQASPNIATEQVIQKQCDQVNPITDEILAASMQTNQDSTTEVTPFQPSKLFIEIPRIPSLTSTLVNRTINSFTQRNEFSYVPFDIDLERGLVERNSQNANSIPLRTKKNLIRAKFPREDRQSLDPYVQVLNDFSSLILGEPTAAEPLPEPFLWYTNFLEGRFKSAWPSLLQPTIQGISKTSAEPGLYEIIATYKLMSKIAAGLVQTSNLALVDIVDKLSNEHMLSDDTNDRAVPNQLIFAAIGWLTMLYEPVLRPDPGQLEIVNPGTRHQRSTGSLISYKQDMDFCDQPFNLLLRKFGDIIPKPDRSLLATSELISVSSVCFSVLSNVAGIKIEWVNSLSLHLEFDSIRKTLKIFRFPSFCKMMYLDSNTTSQLYLDNQRISGERGEPGNDLTSSYYREVLLTYRLIFGQDKASWKAFRKASASWQLGWDRSGQGSDDGDPLLQILCGSSYKSPKARRIYREIDTEADEVSPIYYPDSDFLFLGRRLLNIQAFVKNRNPHNFRALWYDRRNVGFWWIFWAVFLIGGGTILLGFLQLAFQIWTVVSPKE